MTAPNDDTPAHAVPLPAEWEREARSRLEPGENTLSWFAPDLDARLRYREGLVLLTDRRVVSGDGVAWEAWRLDPDLTLTVRDRAGLGTLELVGPAGRLGHWRFTLGRGAGAHRLVDRLDAHRRGAPVVGAPPEDTPCPSCGAPIAPGLAGCTNCAPEAAATSSASLLRLFQFARPRMGAIVLGFVLTLASTAVGLLPPYLTVPLLKVLRNPARDYHLVKWYLLGMAVAALATWLLSWARTFVIAWVSERISADLRNHTYEHLQQLSLEYFGGKRTGDLMSRISSETDRICNFLSINVLDFGTDVIMMAMTGALLFAMDPTLAAVTLLPLPVIAWLVQVARGQLRRSFLRGGRAWSEMTSVLADTIPGIRVVKAFAQEAREVERFRASNERVLQANDRVNTIWSFFGPVVALLTQSGLLVIWAFGAWQVSKNKVDVEVLVGFQLLISRFYVRLESMSRIVQATQRAATSTQRIFEILDRTPSVAEPARPVPVGRVRGEIAIRHAGFRHGSRMILEGIDLTVRPGEMIGLVGPTGSGKSTLVNLVCRFYDVDEGSILVDGVDIRSYPVSDYRRQIGIVLQEPFLFFGSIAENIAYGRPDAGREEIINAARAARCHDFILRLPDGYDSLVGERGQTLSGGERQRISIARALLIDPRILILDEATSAVDTETEREIQEALDNLIQGRTTIAIAHRLSTLRKADRIVVLERGRVVETGQHHALLQAGGAYARLHKAQLELAAGTRDDDGNADGEVGMVPEASFRSLVE